MPARAQLQTLGLQFIFGLTIKAPKDMGLSMNRHAMWHGAMR